jgi:hypothetical protein
MARERPSTLCSGLPVGVHYFVWSVIILVAVILVGISRAGQGRNMWGGWRESSELRRPVYSERVYIHEVFRTRANTWSNLAYLVVGLYGIAIGWYDLRHPYPGAAGSLAQTPALSLAFGLACCYLGAGSGLFHASLTRLGQQLDVAAMYVPLLVLIAINLVRWIPHLSFGRRHRNIATWPILVVLVGFASVFLFLYKWSMSSRIVLCTLIATLGLLAVLDHFRVPRKKSVRWLVWSCLALVTAVICRQLDIAGRFTGPDAWLQGHALWHIFTSLSLGCIYLYYRSEGTEFDTEIFPGIDHVSGGISKPIRQGGRVIEHNVAGHGIKSQQVLAS